MALAGSIRSYLPSKRYGFIRGEDERDYFFHLDDLGQGLDVAQLVEGRRVAFDGVPTPKGYKARGVRALAQAGEPQRFRVPDEVFLDDKRGGDDWQVLEFASWTITASGRGNPRLVRDGLRDLARLVGANAVLEVRYGQSIGAEAGSGQGTHYFTVHEFTGRPAMVGRPSLVAGVDAESLSGLDERASHVKQIYAKRTANARLRWWIFVAVVVALGIWGGNAYSPLAFIPMGFVILYALISGPANHDDWLVRSPINASDVAR